MENIELQKVSDRRIVEDVQDGRGYLAICQDSSKYGLKRSFRRFYTSHKFYKKKLSDLSLLNGYKNGGYGCMVLTTFFNCML